MAADAQISTSVWLPWCLRLAWLSLPVTAGSVLASALDDRSAAVQLTVATVAWAAWAAGVVALLVRRPAGLTVLRIIAPAVLAVTAWAAVDEGDGTALLLLALSVIPVLLAFLPEVGQWMVDGAAYGDERRFPLRAPGALLLGPIPLAEAALLAGALTGPVLLAAQKWVLGGIALAVGLPVAYVCARALHALANRWVVLVPAGLVLKDHVTMSDPVLFKRTEIERLRPAPADTDALDLTARAPGLALELRLKEMTPLTVIQPGKRETRPGKSSRLLFTPTRPGALLVAAGEKRIPIG